MIRKMAAEAAAESERPLAETLGDVLRMENQWLDQFMAFQSASIASWWALQGEWMRAFGGAAGELPVWMVWHNGTEQLA